jgi:arylsulfatase A-like enzyme
MGEKRPLSRRKFVKKVALGGLGLAGGGLAYSLLRKPPGPAYPPESLDAVGPLQDFAGNRPNIVLINADDLGYGDLSCYGSRAIETPNIDRLSEEGVRFTDFHTCDSVCTPSRAGLLTGRYPIRMMLDTPLQPGNQPLKKRAVVGLGYLAGRIGLVDLATRGAAQGIHQAEITLPEALRAGGYRTGMVGKWHLGDFTREPRFNPVNHGFEWFFGVPYSNDMDPFPLYRNGEILEADVPDQAELTGLYTKEAIEFIGSPSQQPFFLYFAHTFPHRPLSASGDFAGSSAGGLYGDVVQEIDWSVGRILETLDESGLAENTLVFFTSDNGPWYQGSTGPLRGRKGQSFEGGHRVPFLARAPGLIPAGSQCTAPATNLDLFPTCLATAGMALPTDRIIDGLDITPLLKGESDRSPHEYLYLYHQGVLEGIRSGDWKYFRSTSHYTWPMPNNRKLGFLTDHTTGPLPLLHNLSTDPGEAYNLAERFPEVVTRLDAAMTAWEEALASNPLGFIR